MLIVYVDAADDDNDVVVDNFFKFFFHKMPFKKNIPLFRLIRSDECIFFVDKSFRTKHF